MTAEVGKTAGLRAAKNAILLVALRVTMPLLSVALVMAISRLLGVQGLGRFTLAYSFLSLLTAIGPLGLNAVVTREGARDRSLLDRTLANAMTLCMGHGILLTVVMSALGLFLNYDTATSSAIVVLSFAIIPCTLGMLLDGAAIAIERVDQIAKGITVEYVIKLGGGIALLLLGFGLEVVLVMAVIGKIAACALQIHLLRRARVHVRLGLDRAVARRLLFLLPTFLGISVFGTLYWRIDILMLSRLRPVEDVGYYGAAYRILELAMIFPQSITMALYPQIAATVHQDLARLQKIGKAALRYLTIINLPIAVCAVLLAEPGLRLLYGPGFSPAEATLAVLMFVLVPYGLVRYHAYVLVGANHQHVDLALNVLMLTVNVGLNLILIPRYSHLGAAAATLVAIVLYAILQWYYLRKKLPGHATGIPFSPSLILVTCATGACVWLLRAAPLALSVGAGCVVYFTMLAISGFFSREELAILQLDRILTRLRLMRS